MPNSSKFHRQEWKRTSPWSKNDMTAYSAFPRRKSDDTPLDVISPMGPEYDEYLQGPNDILQNSDSGYTKCSQNLESPDLYKGRGAIFRSWWWGEIVAVAVSIAAMIAMLVVLAQWNGKALARWVFFFQPNTIVSILAMVSKASMMLVVSACLSQLKWKHFQDRPRPLSHLQVFDDASRGPWGSLVFVGSLRFGSALGLLFAIVTIVGLAIDPAAQQILEFPSRTAKLENVTANIGVAMEYESLAYTNLYPQKSGICMFTSILTITLITLTLVPALPIEYWNQNTLTLESQLLNAMFGTVDAPAFSCPRPASSCTFPKFSSMGVCGSFRNLTDVSFYNCTSGSDGIDPTNLTCIYDYAGRNQSESLVEMTWVVTDPDGDGKQSVSDFTWFRSATTTHTDEIGGKSLSMTSVRVRDTQDSPSDDGPAPPTEMLQSSWYLCQHTYEGAVIDSGTLVPGKASSEQLVPVRNRTIPASKTGYLYDENIITYRADSTGLEYTTVTFPLDRIYGFLTKALENRFGLYGNASYVDSGNNDILALGYYLNITDLKSMTENLAVGISAQMRGQSPGDNKNLTMLGGDAFAEETYIRVRWQWMMLPLVEVVLAALLLVATIFKTRAGPLLKSSVAAFLLHGLDGWDAADVKAGSLETSDDLERRSRAMIAAFAEDEDGWLRFARKSRSDVIR